MPNPKKATAPKKAEPKAKAKATKPKAAKPKPTPLDKAMAPEVVALSERIMDAQVERAEKARAPKGWTWGEPYRVFAQLPNNGGMAHTELRLVNDDSKLSAVAAEARIAGSLIVDQSNVFAQAYLAVAQACESLISLCSERGPEANRGLPRPKEVQ